MTRLQDKVVLVTGAAGAVGQAVATAVKREGGHVIASDLPQRGGIDHALDVTGEADWQRVLGEVDRAHGRLDGLVNAAGIALLGSIEDTDYACSRSTSTAHFSAASTRCRCSSAGAARSSICRRCLASSVVTIWPPTTPRK